MEGRVASSIGEIHASFSTEEAFIVRRRTETLVELSSVARTVTSLFTVSSCERSVERKFWVAPPAVLQLLNFVLC